MLLRRQVLWAVVAVAVAATASILSLKWLPIPWAWVALIWTALCAVAVARLPSRLRPLLSSLMAVAVALGLAELWFAMTLPAEVVKSFVPTFYATDPVLGWGLRPAQRTRATARAADAIVYDVTYSTDAAGRRISPPADSVSGRQGCVFVFSDSFAFGEGVEDDESLPHRLGALAGGRLQVVNFGVPGYGAEHMLARIERGDLSRAVPCEPTQVVYLALTHHILRAAGKVPISTAGPRYRLDDQGVARYLGTPSRPAPGARNAWAAAWDAAIGKSRIRRALTSRLEPPTSADAALYYAIVSRAFALCAQRWPHARRHIVSWDLYPEYAFGIDRFHAGLALSDAQIHLIDDIVPGYSRDARPHSLPGDVHPNPKTYDTVARYLATRLQTGASRP